jgi:hypothetical protein
MQIIAADDRETAGRSTYPYNQRGQRSLGALSFITVLRSISTTLLKIREATVSY